MQKQIWEMSILQEPIALSTQVSTRRSVRPVANALATANYLSTVASNSTLDMQPIVFVATCRQTLLETTCVNFAAYQEHPTMLFSRRFLQVNRRSAGVTCYSFEANVLHTLIPAASAGQGVKHVWSNRMRQTASPRQVPFNHSVQQPEIANQIGNRCTQNSN